MDHMVRINVPRAVPCTPIFDNNGPLLLEFSAAHIAPRKEALLEAIKHELEYDYKHLRQAEAVLEEDHEDKAMAAAIYQQASSCIEQIEMIQKKIEAGETFRCIEFIASKIFHRLPH